MPSASAGDRFPDVLVHDSEGPRSLYNRHQGGEVVIAWGFPSAQMTALEQSHPVVVVALSKTSMASRWIEASPDLSAWVTGGASQGALVLDASLRVRQRVSLENPAELDQALAVTTPVTQGLSGAAPVLSIPRVLEPELVADVIAHFRLTGGEPSGVLHYAQGKPEFAIDPSVKMRRETIIRASELEQRIHDRLMQRALPEIHRAFAFQVRNREHFKIIAYHAGAGYFRAHRDNDTADVAHRRFAMTLNLNTGNYSGGCLRFPEFGPHLYETQAGGALVFSCSLLHEATDVVAGERLAMTTFLY